MGNDDWDLEDTDFAEDWDDMERDDPGILPSDRPRIHEGKCAICGWEGRAIEPGEFPEVDEDSPEEDYYVMVNHIDYRTNFPCKGGGKPPKMLYDNFSGELDDGDFHLDDEYTSDPLDFDGAD